MKNKNIQNQSEPTIDCDELISFRKRKDDLFITGVTPKGNKVSYVPIDETTLIYVNIDAITNDEYIIDTQEPTRLVLYFSFRVTMPMMDILESSGILHNLHLTNLNKQLLAYPLPEFDYENLKGLLADLVREFDL